MQAFLGAPDHHALPLTPQAHHWYTYYQALGSTFQWIAANAPLTLQHPPGLPFPAPLALPVTDDWQQLLSGLTAALADPAQLGEVGHALERSTGEGGRVGVDSFTALIPRICDVISALHLDLPALSKVAGAIYEAQLTAATGKRQQASPREPQPGTLQEHQDDRIGGPRERQPQRNDRDEDGVVLSGSRRLQSRAGRQHGRQLRQGRASGGSANGGSMVRRRLHAIMRPNYNYSSPPNGFVPAPPGKMPPLLLPLVVHVLSYIEGGDVGPVGLDRSPEWVDRWVQVCNIMATSTNIQFFVQVRNMIRTVHGKDSEQHA